MTIKPLHILSGDLWGGGEAQMALQIQAIRRLGVEAEVILFNEGDTATKFRARGIPLTITAETLGVLNVAALVAKTLRAKHSDIIVTHGYKELFCAVLSRSGLPIVHVTHGLVEGHSGVQALKMGLYKTLESILCRLAVSRRVAVTEAMKKALGETSIKVIRNVAELTTQANPIAAPGSEATEGQIVSVGRLFRVKRFDRAIRIVSDLVKISNKPVALQIVGDGPLLGELESLAQSLNSPTQFLGFRSDAASLIQSAKTLLITSDSEGLPTVLLEAMFGGTPVCSIDLPGIREALALIPGYPHTIFTNDGDAVTALATALEMPRASKEIRDMVAKLFSPERAAKEHLSLYEEICNNGSDER